MTMQTLALENSLLRCGIEAARIGMCVLDDNGIILLITDRFAKALCKEVDLLLGRIVSAMTRLALDLGMSVTAEGVENQLRHENLLATGCGFGPGHFYGFPGQCEPFSL